jgi:hypothetical protein
MDEKSLFFEGISESMAVVMLNGVSGFLMIFCHPESSRTGFFLYLIIGTGGRSCF